MSNNQFVMVSEWMSNGNITEFIKTHKDANRFKLVWICSHRGLHLSLMRSFPPIAWRHCSRIDIYARSGDGTWGLERGMISDTRHHSFSNVDYIRRTL